VQLDGTQSRTNDAQKTMGIITLALFTGTQAAASTISSLVKLLKTPVSCCLNGDRFVRCDHGRGTAAAAAHHSHARPSPWSNCSRFMDSRRNDCRVNHQGASYYGIPLSTTHVISASIMGVGAVKRFSGMRGQWLNGLSGVGFHPPSKRLIGYALERVLAAH